MKSANSNLPNIIKIIGVGRPGPMGRDPTLSEPAALATLTATFGSRRLRKFGASQPLLQRDLWGAADYRVLRKNTRGFIPGGLL